MPKFFYKDSSNKNFNWPNYNFFSYTKKPAKKDRFFTQNKSLHSYRSLSTDFTSLSSLWIFLFARNKNTIEISGNIGSIPFSGKTIPPGKFSNQ